MNIDHFGFGCVALTTQKNLSRALHILETAYDNGITYFDTAPLYGQGFSEKILGRFANNKRRKIRIATKVGLGGVNQKNIPINIALCLNSIKSSIKTKTNDNISNQPILPVKLEERTIAYEYLKKSIENSLKNLNCDYIDVLHLHEAMPFFLSDEALNYLFKLKDSGVVNKIGIACSFINYLDAKNDYINLFDVLQYEWLPEFGSHQILEKYPNKQHIYHSAFKYLRNDLTINRNDKIKSLLTDITMHNPNAILLFSTSKHHNLIHNIKIFKKIA